MAMLNNRRVQCFIGIPIVTLPGAGVRNHPQYVMGFWGGYNGIILLQLHTSNSTIFGKRMEYKQEYSNNVSGWYKSICMGIWRGYNGIWSGQNHVFGTWKCVIDQQINYCKTSVFVYILILVGENISHQWMSGRDKYDDVRSWSTKECDLPQELDKSSKPDT